jgi:hypothetical protein
VEDADGIRQSDSFLVQYKRMLSRFRQYMAALIAQSLSGPKALIRIERVP